MIRRAVRLKVLAWAVLPLLLVLVVVGGGLFLAGSTGGGVGAAYNQSLAACGSGGGAVQGQPVAGAPAVTGDAADLDAAQQTNAKAIVGVALSRGLGERGAAIGVAAAIAESTLYNYGNDGTSTLISRAHGRQLNDAERAVARESLNYPHDRVGNNLDSMGLFQQRPMTGWGAPAVLMNPASSAGLFYDRMVGVADWQTMSPWTVAQAVQGSPSSDGGIYRTAYDQAVAIARSYTLADGAGPTAPTAPNASGAPSPAPPVDAVPAVAALPAVPSTCCPSAPVVAAVDVNAPAPLADFGPENVSGNAVNTQAAIDFVLARWPQVGYASGWRANGSVSTSYHPRGKAVDVGINDWSSASGVALGDEVAAWFIGNPTIFGTEEVIWRDRIWTPSGGWRNYTHPDDPSGTDPTLAHRDHVHASLASGPNPAAGAPVTATPAAAPAVASGTVTTAGCAAAPGVIGPVDVQVNGVDVTIPDHPNVDPAVRGVTIKAPTEGMARGLAAGFASLGLPYVWGGGNASVGGGPDDGCARGGGQLNSCQGLVGFDCSGLVAYVHVQAGYPSPGGNSGAQRAGGHLVPYSSGVPGDVVGFPGHVAIYLGFIDGTPYILEASTVGVPVQIEALTRSDRDGSLHRHWAGATQPV